MPGVAGRHRIGQADRDAGGVRVHEQPHHHRHARLPAHGAARVKLERPVFRRWLETHTGLAHGDRLAWRGASAPARHAAGCSQRHALCSGASQTHRASLWRPACLARGECPTGKQGLFAPRSPGLPSTCMYQRAASLTHSPCAPCKLDTCARPGAPAGAGGRGREHARRHPGHGQAAGRARAQARARSQLAGARVQGGRVLRQGQGQSGCVAFVFQLTAAVYERSPVQGCAACYSLHSSSKLGMHGCRHVCRECTVTEPWSNVVHRPREQETVDACERLQ